MLEVPVGSWARIGCAAKVQELQSTFLTTGVSGETAATYGGA